MRTCSTRNRFMECFRPSEIDSDYRFPAVSNSDKKPGFRRSFSAVFKSAGVYTSLSKKVRDINRSKSYNQFRNEFESSSSPSSPSSSNSHTPIEHHSKSPTSTSTPGSSFGSYELGRCLEEDEGESIKDLKKVEKGMSLKSGTRMQGLNMNHLVYLVVLSLLVTVLCSKSLAVVITTVWIFTARIITRHGRSVWKFGVSVCFLLRFLSCSS